MNATATETYCDFLMCVWNRARFATHEAQNAPQGALEGVCQ